MSELSEEMRAWAHEPDTSHADALLIRCADALDAQAQEIARLAAELGAIKAQASDATEYVLATENMRLRGALEKLSEAAGRGLFCGACLTGRGLHEPGCELVAARETIAALESREVCAAAHDDVETCGYCQRDALRGRAEAAERDAERLKRGLKFYAEGDHFQNDGAFDTVSGEPQNFWCDQEGSMVEDGTVAKKFLEGWDVDDDDNWIVPAIDAARGGA